MLRNPDNAPEKQVAYVEKLKGMTDEALFKETKDKIWFSAFANNNPHSCYHWQCDATYSEWCNRDKVDEYSRAHDEVRESL